VLTNYSLLKPLLSDADLWTNIRKDDLHAYNTLFDRYWVRLYKSAYNLTHDQETSKEIVHDIFLNIWKRRNELQIESFPQFLLTAIRYQFYNRNRAAKSPLSLIPDYEMHDTLAQQNEGELRLDYNDFEHTLKNHLGVLPNRCQEIFVMSRIQNISNDEIAENLRISKRTVENQITHALKHLRGVLKCLMLFF